MRVWCDLIGYPQSLIQSQIARARKLNAPQDILEENGQGKWLRLGDLKGATARDYLARTVVEMTEGGRA
jgi:hypothetical protein